MVCGSPLNMGVFTAIPKEPKWILNDTGTTLEKIELNTKMENADIGYLLLIILSKYLGGHYSIRRWGDLRNYLVFQGWSEEQSWIPICGYNLATSINPSSDSSCNRFVASDDPYYYWMIPIFSNRRGWLSFSHITSLEIELEKVFASSKSSAQEEVIEAYNDLKMILTSAKQAGSGLFMVIA
jgi:hypothetical protein